MTPQVHQSRSTLNHYEMDVSWNTNTKMLTISPFSGSVSEKDFDFTEPHTHTPDVGGENRVTIAVYLAWNPDTDEVEVFVDERDPDHAAFSPQDAGYKNLAMLVWADWRAGESDPFSFHASKCIYEPSEGGRA